MIAMMHIIGVIAAALISVFPASISASSTSSAAISTSASASLSSSSVARSPATSELIVWNVGQGQWVTWVEGGTCHHFDLGGERAPWSMLHQVCGKKRNVAHFSHWDWDHIGFANAALRRLFRLCVHERPAGPAIEWKRRWLARIPACRPETTNAGVSQAKIVQVFGQESPNPSPRDTTPHTPPPPADGSTPSRRHASRSSANDASRVFLLPAARALIPGDSTTAKEAQWSPRLAQPASIRLLVLGHHGSRTSTSPGLLQRLRGLKQAIASARFARYGHPHASVAKRLRLHRVALVSTEDWGTLRFEMKAVQGSMTLGASTPKD